MIAALNLRKKVFVMHVAYLEVKMLIYLAYKIQITLLVTEKVIILIQYLNFANIFSKKSAIKLYKRLKINKHIINLELSKQLSYKLIYNFGPVKLKTYKIYIIINLANCFI